MICWRWLRRTPRIFGGVLAAAAVRLDAHQLDAPAIVCHPDAVAAAETIQACLDNAPAFSIVDIPAGTYVLHHQVLISKPVTLRTGDLDASFSCVAVSDKCAVLLAAPDFVDSWGLLVARSTTNVRLEHLVIDGNRSARDASDAALNCLKGDNIYGFNASVLECVECRLNDVVSKNGLCGTGMAWTGGQATIENSRFMSNGDATTQSMWSDGLTLLYAPRAVVRGNTFDDNSDVALIIGYGVDSRIEKNVVVQRRQPAFAGLMLDNFNSNDRSMKGDFQGAVIAHNTIDCDILLCTFGIQLGPHPWYPTNNIVGGEVHDNTVTGAKIGINVDGAGEHEMPTAVFNNRAEPPLRGSYFSKCAQPIPAEWMNIAPASVVDRRGEDTKVGAHLSDGCQLFSNLSME